jgi:hypothetical protein
MFSKRERNIKTGFLPRTTFCGFIHCIHYRRKVDVLGAIWWIQLLYWCTQFKYWSNTGHRLDSPLLLYFRLGNLNGTSTKLEMSTGQWLTLERPHLSAITVTITINEHMTILNVNRDIRKLGSFHTHSEIWYGYIWQLHFSYLPHVEVRLDISPAIKRLVTACGPYQLDLRDPYLQVKSAMDIILFNHLTQVLH